MHVVGDAGAGGAAGVGADVEALRFQSPAQDRDRPFHGPHEVGGLGVVEAVELAHMGNRGDHNVARVVRESVQEDDRVLRSPNHEYGIFVVGILEDAAEEAAGPLLGGYVLHAPRRPQSLH